MERTIRENIQWIGHFHTGGNPGRHEIDETQELNYRFVARAIADLGFAGFVAHEYRCPWREGSHCQFWIRLWGFSRFEVERRGLQIGCGGVGEGWGGNGDRPPCPRPLFAMGKGKEERGTEWSVPIFGTYSITPSLRRVSAGSLPSS